MAQAVYTCWGLSPSEVKIKTPLELQHVEKWRRGLSDITENDRDRDWHVLHSVCLLLAVVLLWSLPGLGASRIPFGGNITLPIDEPVQTTNPIYAATDSEILISRQIHETLLRKEKDGSFVPALAQSIPDVSDDGLEVRIQIRPGLVFHDGSPVDAHALVSSWKNLLRPESASPYWWLLADIDGALAFHLGKSSKISGLERVNSLTVRVRLEHDAYAAGEFFEAISSLPTALLPAREKRKGAQKLVHPPGAGPFVMDLGAQDGEYILAPFTRHWEGRPYVKNAVFRTIPTAKKRILEFELGRLDAVKDRPRTKVDKLSVFTGPLCHRYFLVLNEKRSKSFPEGFKQAMLNAVDRNALSDYVVGEMGKSVDEFFLPVPGDISTKLARPDISAAKLYFKSIAEQRFGVAGLIQLVVRSNSLIDRTIAERLQVDLVEAGVVLVVVPLDDETYKARVESGDYELRLEHLQAFVHSAQLQLIQVGVRTLSDASTEDLLHWLERLPRSKSREGIIREHARSLTVNSNWVPLFVSGTKWFVGKRVHDFSMGQNGLLDLSKVWLAP